MNDITNQNHDSVKELMFDLNKIVQSGEYQYNKESVTLETVSILAKQLGYSITPTVQVIGIYEDDAKPKSDNITRHGHLPEFNANREPHIGEVLSDLDTYNKTGTSPMVEYFKGKEFINGELVPIEKCDISNLNGFMSEDRCDD